jgi:hypothetical protein
MGSSCNALQWLWGSVAPPGPTTGHFSAFAETSYDPNGNCVIQPYQNPNPTAIAAEFQKQMGIYEQLQSAYISDNVNASQFVAAEANSDWMWFSGHGDPGLIELYHCQESGYPANTTSWGPGSTSGQYPSNVTGFPIQGLMKWIFAYSSDTVALPPNLLPSSPTWTADWSGAFATQLHGIYGFYQQPGNCQPNQVGFTGGGVTCDIVASAGSTFVDDFVGHLLASTPVETVHNAWVNAASEAGFGDRWSIWEINTNLGDVLSGPGGPNAAANGVLMFYYSVNPAGIAVGAPSSIGNDTFTLEPTTLTPENLNDTTLLAQAASSLGESPTSYTNNGTISIATKGAGSVRHYLLSGALSFHGASTTNAVVFDEATAEAAAVQAATGVNGMPSDAVLSEVAQQYSAEPTSGGATLTGYLFTWKHQSPIASGDAIRVNVTDYQTVTSACTGGWKVITITPHPVAICQGWTTTYTDNPNIAYMFRMWHSVAGRRSTLSSGQTSLTAATAAAALPPGAVVISYTNGMWSPPFDSASANQGTPAWIFTLYGGDLIYVDAYTGQILGAGAD